MRFGGCYMALRAKADDENFTLSWWQEEYGDDCRIKVHGNSLELHDLDTDNQSEVSIFRRVFLTSGPDLDIHQPVDLVSLIPGFAAVPAAERRYTLSLFVKRVFQGSLPNSARIQLPDIIIGDRVITPPPLQLKRRHEMLSWWDEYISDGDQNVAESTWLSEFGENVQGSEVIWYEEKSLVRLASDITGRPFAYSEEDPYKKIKDKSEVHGRIFIEVLGDQTIRLTDGQVSWHVPGDTQDHLIPVNHSKWKLKMYTTADLSERLNHFSDYSETDNSFEDSHRDFVVVIPGYKPQRFKVLLPRTTVNEHEWPLKPILFEYKPGGVGVWSM
jgi:hypothetical protein